MEDLCLDTGHAIRSAPVVLSISLYYHYIITSKVVCHIAGMFGRMEVLCIIHDLSN